MRWSHHENSIMLNAIKTQLTMDASPPADTPDLIAFIDHITKGGERAMADMTNVARKQYFHPSTQGSCSIKKVLPEVMQSAAFLKAKYSQPVYGALGGIFSNNFSKMVWWQQDASGAVLAPYKLLVSELGEDSTDDEAEGINQGGAASNAYLKLQFENFLGSERF